MARATYKANCESGYKNVYRYYTCICACACAYIYVRASMCMDKCIFGLLYEFCIVLMQVKIIRFECIIEDIILRAYMNMYNIA